MLVLGIDSSTSVATVAVASEEKILGEYNVDDKNTHSKKLMPMVENLLEQLELNISDIDFFAVSKGPGSFTGLRIGVATVKAFSYALDKRIVGVSSLYVIANNHRYFDGLVVPMMDARNERVFASVYRGDGEGLSLLRDEEAVEVEKLFEALDGAESSIMFAGDGSLAYREKIKERFKNRAVFSEIHLNASRAASLCALAFEKHRNSEFEDSFALSPDYLRDSQAQQQREKQRDG